MPEDINTANQNEPNEPSEQNTGEAGTTQVNEGNSSERTFTQEEVNKLVGQARTKERDKYKDYEEMKKKVEQYDTDISDLNGKLERLNSLEEELNGLKEKNARAELVSKQAKESGVDAELLSLMAGSTEEEIASNAEILKAKIGAMSIYPTIKDNGSTNKNPITKEEILGIKNQKERLKAIAENKNLFV